MLKSRIRINALFATEQSTHYRHSTNLYHMDLVSQESLSA